MSKLISITVFLTIFAVTLGDHERPGKYMKHDSTVINCARYKREANQHSCVLAPFSVEGPYFLPDDLERSNIAEDKVGISLDLTIRLVNSNNCTPLSNMFVHIWHADALGTYSGVKDFTMDFADFFKDMKPGNKSGPPFWEQLDKMKPNDSGPFGPSGPSGPFGPFGPGGAGKPNRPGRPGRSGKPDGPGRSGKPGDLGNMSFGGRPTPVNNERYLRGYQVTNEAGEVNFKTIIPGWYTGRCLHIHIEVYPKNTTNAGEVNYIGQMFFQEDLPAELKLIEPYSLNQNYLILNSRDFIYRSGQGETTTLKLETRETGTGYFSSMTFGIDPTHHQ